MARQTQIIADVLSALGLPKLVGRPGHIAFGPFTFVARAIEADLSAAGGDVELLTDTTAVDKQLTAISSSRQYWLMIYGFRARWGYTGTTEDASTLGNLAAYPYLASDVDSQFTYQQMEPGAAASVETTSTGTATIAQNIVGNPTYLFKYPWIVDAENDRLFVASDFDTLVAGEIDLNLELVGFAISKSVMEAAPKDIDCGSAALKELARQSNRSFASVASLLGRD